MRFLAGFISAALTATLLSLGFAAPAQAACDNYGPCIDTRLDAWPKKNPIRAGQRAPFIVRLRAENGAYPHATIQVVVKRRSNGDVVWSGERAYNDRRETYRTGPLPKGAFTVYLRAHTRSDRFEDGRARFGLRVNARR